MSLPETARSRAVGAWFVDATADLASARSLSAHRDEGTAPFASAFHAQQAVEKGLKALLVWHGVDFPARHDLGLLLDLVPAGSAAREMDVRGLTVYAVDQRYVAGLGNPMDPDERPTWDEADEAVRAAAATLARISADLVSAGWTPAL